MPVRKYYCDYCDKQFQDTPADRKRHARGIHHIQAKARWYDSFKLLEQQQRQQHLFPLPNPNPPQGPQPTPFCFHFINTGFCRYGDSCKYIHPNANHKSGALDSNIQQQPAIISMGLGSHLVGEGSTSTPTPGNVVRDSLGMSWGNLPPSLQPPPEGGYPPLPFVDWG